MGDIEIRCFEMNPKYAVVMGSDGLCEGVQDLVDTVRDSIDKEEMEIRRGSICLLRLRCLTDYFQGAKAEGEKELLASALAGCVKGYEKLYGGSGSEYLNHAKKYADCRGIEHIGWKDPLEKGLERMIEERKLYPITFLKGLDGKSKERFFNAGIILFKQLVEYNLDELYKETRIQKKKLEDFIEKARNILS